MNKRERFLAAFRTRETNTKNLNQRLGEVKGLFERIREVLQDWMHDDPGDPRPWLLKKRYQALVDEAKEAARDEKPGTAYARLFPVLEAATKLFTEVAEAWLAGLPEDFTRQVVLDYTLVPKSTDSEYVVATDYRILVELTADKELFEDKVRYAWLNETANDAATPYRKQAAKLVAKLDRKPPSLEKMVSAIEKVHSKLEGLCEEAAEAAQLAVMERIADFEKERQAKQKWKARCRKKILTGTLTITLFTISTVLSGGVTAWGAWYAAAGGVRILQQVVDICKSAETARKELVPMMLEMQQRIESARSGLKGKLDAKLEHTGDVGTAAVLSFLGLPGDWIEKGTTTGTQAANKLQLMRAKIAQADEKTGVFANALNELIAKLDATDTGSLSGASFAIVMAPKVDAHLKDIVKLQEGLRNARKYASDAESVIREYQERISLFRVLPESGNIGALEVYEGLYMSGEVQQSLMGLNSMSFEGLIQHAGDLVEVGKSLV